MAKFLTYCFVLFSFLGSAQVLLPGYKNGNWWIIRSDSSFALPSNYSSLALFDSKGYIIFEDNKSQGILDSNGTVLYQSEDQDISSWGNGVFSFRNSEKNWVLNVETGDTLCADIDGFHMLNERYLRYYHNQDTVLFHIPSQKSWPIEKTAMVHERLFQSVILRQDSVRVYLFDPNGNQVLLDRMVAEYTYVLPYVFAGKQYVLTYNRHFEVPVVTANIVVQEPYLSYFDGKMAHLIDLENDEEIAQVPYQSILPYPENGYLVTKNGKTGLLNSSFVLKIPVKYDQIFVWQEFYYVTNGGLQGMLDKNYNLRIPCEFSQIYSDSTFIYTFNDRGMEGLFSVDYKPILETMYDRIFIKDRLIKAYKGKKLRILKLDANDKVLSDIILDNAITAKQKIANDVFYFDKRLLPLGWFYERTPVFDSIGIIVKYNTKWGLRSGDSILTKPKYYNPIYVTDAPFTYFTFTGLKFNLINLNYEVQTTYRLINYGDGKFTTNDNYLRFNEEDGVRRSFYRCATTKGHQIYRKSGEKENVNYISQTSNRLVPYAKEGKLEIVANNSESVPYGQWLPFNPWRIGLLEGQKYYNWYKKSVQMKEAKWNFLDTNGTDRFQEPFTFATDYYKGTAIVKKASGWGVVDEDREIIPFDFSEIKRVRMWNDTIFIVKKSSRKYQFLDSNLTQVATDYNSLAKKKNEMALLSAQADNALFFQGEEIQDELKNARLINDNYWVIKEKKEYVILDQEAQEVCRTLNKPVRVLSAEFILVESQGKQAVVRTSGDTVLQFGVKEIQKFPYYYLVQNQEGTNLFNREFQLVVKEKPGQKILPNHINKNYAILSKESIKQYNEQNKLLAKRNHQQAQKIKMYQYNYFIADQFLLEDTMEIKLGKDDKLEIQKDGTVRIQRAKLRNVFYTETLIQPLIEVSVKNVIYLGSRIVSYTQDGKCFVTNGIKGIELPMGSVPIGKYNDGFCLFAKGKKFMYLDENLEIAISKRFQEANPFENGMACVKYNGAWTLMSPSGQMKSFPSYSSIQPISTNFFQTKDLPTYGLYDSHGKVIIPAIYEKLIFITPEIIQVVLKGEMGYLDIHGNSIFSIQ